MHGDNIIKQLSPDLKKKEIVHFHPGNKKKDHRSLGLNEDNFACTKLVSSSLNQPLCWLYLSSLELSLPSLAGEMAPSLWQWPFPLGLLPTSTQALDSFMSEKSPPIVLSSDSWGLIVRAASTNLADLICSLNLLALHHVIAFVSSSLLAWELLERKGLIWFVFILLRLMSCLQRALSEWMNIENCWPFKLITRKRSWTCCQTFFSPSKWDWKS